MNAELNETQRAVLKALCDTFVPSIKVANDPIGFWARTASDLGVDCVIARNLTEDVPPKLYLIIRFFHPAMMTRYGCGAVRAQA